MTVDTGHFAVLRRARSTAISDDQRIQAVIIAFSFGALLEALAGFGTPVAITAVMLIARRLQADEGGRGRARRPTPRRSPSARSRSRSSRSRRSPACPKDDLGAMVGRQTPILALIVPLILVGMVDGMRGVRQAWPAAVVGGFDVRARPVRVLELHLGRADRHRRLAARPPARSSLLLQVWQPDRAAARRGQRRRRAARDRRRRGRPTRRTRPRSRRKERQRPRLRRGDLRRLRALPDHHRRLRASPSGARSRTSSTSAHQAFDWPGLNIQNAGRRGAVVGRPSSSTGPTPPARCCSSRAC